MLGVFLFFTVLAAPGLDSGLSHDDLMNTYFAWRQPIGDVILANFKFWSTSVRPLGALFYAGFHHLFGLNPLPMRIFCFGVLYCNIGLTYWLGYRLSGSIAVAFLASLLHCFHRNFQPLYYGTGNCYDVFSFFFYMLALAWYVELRERGRLPGVQQTIGFLSLYVCSLNSKEAAVSLPAILLVYEALHSFRPMSSWLWTEARTAFILGVTGLVYVFGKLHGSESLANQEAYQPHFTLQAYLKATTVYLNDMLCQTTAVQPWHAAVLLVAMGGVALWLRDRLIGFAWTLIVLGQAPIAFIYPRGLVSYYIAVFGYALFAAALLLKYARPAWVRVPLLVCVTILLYRWHLARGAYDLDYAFSEERQIAFVRDEMLRHPEWFAPHSSILIKEDPFKERYALSFLVYLIGHETTVRVTRLPDDPIPPDGNFTRVLGVRDGRLTEIPKVF